MSVEKIELYSESSFRFRPVGAVEYTTVPGGRTEVVEVENGTSLEVSSINDNSTIRISGDIDKIEVIESKLTDLSNMVSNSNVSTIIVGSESKIETVSKMISRSIVSDIQINADISAAEGKDEIVELSVVNNALPMDKIDSYGNSIVSVVEPSGYISGLENALSVDGESLDLSNTLNLNNLSGNSVDAFKKFDVIHARGQDIIPSVYNVVHEEQDENFTFEMDITCSTDNVSINREDIENVIEVNSDMNAALTFEMDITCDIGVNTMNREDVENVIEVDNEIDENFTFEMDITCDIGVNTMNREDASLPFEFDNSADTANYTFEMDIINPYTESE